MREVHRFKSADVISSGVQPSEGAESIKIPVSDAENGGKSEFHEREHIVNVLSIYQEDEEFEWREVIRGANATYRRCNVSNCAAYRPN